MLGKCIFYNVIFIRNSDSVDERESFMLEWFLLIIFFLGCFRNMYFNSFVIFRVSV